MVQIEKKPNALWTAAHTKPRCEKVVADYCQRHGVTFYLPLRRRAKRYQRRTVENFLELQQCWGDDDQPWAPVIQGNTVDQYRRCWEMYGKAGIDLKNFPLVGVGSVCRRQATSEIDAVVSALLRLDPGLPLHTFGAKGGGIARYGHKICSADSLAWSYQARRRPPLPGPRTRSRPVPR